MSSSIMRGFFMSISLNKHLIRSYHVHISQRCSIRTSLFAIDQSSSEFFLDLFQHGDLQRGQTRGYIKNERRQGLLAWKRHLC